MKKILHLLLLLPGILYAQDITMSGRISGQTLEGDYVGLVTGATIEIISKSGEKKTATTNGNGYYTFEGLQKGTYTYKITAADYEADEGRGFEIPGDSGIYTRDYVLSKPSDFVEQTGKLTGTTIWTDGTEQKPIENVLISARRISGGNLISAGSDAEGKFSLDLPAGDWRVSAFISGFEPQVHNGVVTLGGELSDHVDFVFSKKVAVQPKAADQVYALISVKIEGSEATPGVNPSVHFVNTQTGDQVHGTVALQEGHGEGVYEWFKADPANPLPPGEYRVSASREGFPTRFSRPKSVVHGLSTWYDVDLAIDLPENTIVPPEALYTGIHGRISGQSKQGDYLGVVNGAKIVVKNEAGEVIKETTSNENGYYLLENVGAGTVLFTIEATDYDKEEGQRGIQAKANSGLQVLDWVLAKDVEEVQLGNVSGSVILKENGETRPLEGTTIALKKENSSGFHSVETDAEGKFSLQVPTGRWAVSAVAGKYGTKVEPNFLMVRADSEATAEFVFEKNADETTTKEVYALVSVQLGGTSNKGGVTPQLFFVSAANGEKYPATVRPKTDAELVSAGLTPRSSSEKPYYEWYHAEAQSELPIGDYHVEAAISLDEYKDDKSEIKTVTEVGSTWFDADLVPLIPMEPEPDPDQSFSLKVHGRISGQSKAGDYDGVLAGASVTIFDQSGKLAGSSMSNSNGYYEFNKLGPGKYSYRVGAPAGTDYENDEGRGFSLPENADAIHVFDVVLARPVPEPPKPENPGTISGEVLVEVDGVQLPVPEAKVYVQREGSRRPMIAMTGETGEYSFDVPKGSWRVAAVEPETGENQVHPNRIIVAPDSNNKADFLFKTTPPPMPEADIVILTKVERGASEKGGDPVVSLKGSHTDAPIELETEFLGVNPASSALFRDLGIEMAFEEGWHWYASFPASEIPPGNYQAKATLDGYVEGLSLTRTAIAGFTTFLDVTLDKIRPEIDVYVICNDKQPIEDAALTFINTTIGQSFSSGQKGETNAQGRFMTELTGGLGAYNVMAAADGFVGWGKAVNVTGNRVSVEIQLFPEDVPPTIDFTGIVVTCGGFDEEGEPSDTPQLMASAPMGLSNEDRLGRLHDGTDKRVANAKVKIRPEDSSVSLPQLSQEFVSNSMGEIKIPELPVGSYNVDITAENHIGYSSSFTISRQNSDPTIFALEPRNLEFENWIRKMITKGDGWQNKKSSSYYHTMGVKEEPGDCRVDYALGLSMFNVSWATSTTSFGNSVQKDKDEVFWDRAVEGHIWMLMAQRQGSKAAAYIQQIATSHYGGASPTPTNRHTAFVMGKAIGVLKGPWSEKNPASLRAYSQNDMTISSALQGQLLAEYKRGRDSVGGKAADITNNAQTQADELKRLAEIEKAKKENEIAGQLAEIEAQIADGLRQLKILDDGFKAYERDVQAQIDDLNRQIQILIAKLNTLVPVQPTAPQMMQTQKVPCAGCAAEFGQYNPNCQYCRQANASSDFSMPTQPDRNTQLRNLLIEQQRQQIISQINAHKVKISNLQAAYDRERRNWINQRNIILANDKRLRARYASLSGQRNNLPNYDDKIDDITDEADKEKTDFKTYCPYPLEERRLELLGWVNRKTDTVTTPVRSGQTVASIAPVKTPEPAPVTPVADMPDPIPETPASDMQKTASGLEYDIESPGYGQQASNGKYIKVHFKGTLPNGIVFANSRDRGQAYEFQLGSSKVIPGLNEGIGMLKKGGKAKLTIPPQLAYGSKGAKGIPANSPVTYEVEVLDVSDSPTQPVAQPAPASVARYQNFRSDPAFNQTLNLRAPDKATVQLAIALVTNEIRKRNGRSELGISPNLANAAQMHAEDMRTYDFFSHNNAKEPSKFDPARRAQMHGVANPNISENINQGFSIRYSPGASVRPLGGGQFASTNGRRIGNHTPVSLADSLLKTWMESAGHKANILDPSAVEIGCGISFFSDPEFLGMPSVYAVQKFQRGQAIRAGGSTAPVTRTNPTTPRRGVIPSQTNRYNRVNSNPNTNSRPLPGGSNSIFEVFGF